MGGRLLVLAKALIRLPHGADMNGNETLYSETLDMERSAGNLHAWYFQRVTLRLGPDLRYTPDFMLIAADGAITFVEVKGFEREDARDKFKMAAELHPWARWVMVRRIRKTKQFETIRTL